MAAQPTWILNSDDTVGLEMATLSQSLCEIDFILLSVPPALGLPISLSHAVYHASLPQESSNHGI